jgi:hypothetical protein
MANINIAKFIKNLAETFGDASNVGKSVTVMGGGQIGVVVPTTGAALSPKGPWTTYTEYDKGDLVTYGGELYSADEYHTSTDTFVASRWEKLVAKGADGAPGIQGIQGIPGTVGPVGAPIVDKGIWQPTTLYNAGEAVTYSSGANTSSLYTAKNTHTSDAVFDSAKWNLRVSSGATGQTGVTGPVGPNPFIVTGLDSTRIRANEFAMLVPGTSYLLPMHPHPADLRDAQFFFKDSANNIHMEGGVIPYTATVLTPGNRIVNIGKIGATALNWTTVVPPIPAELTPTPTKAYTNLGIAVGVDQISFRPRDAVVLDGSALTPFYDDLSSYTLDSIPSTDAEWAYPWDAWALTVQVKADVTHPHGRFLRLDAGSTLGVASRVAIKKNVPDFLDGEIEAIVENDNAAKGTIRVMGRINGTVGAPRQAVGLQFSNDGNILAFSLTDTTLTYGRKADNSLNSFNIGGYTQGTIYRMVVQFNGNRIRGKCHVYGTPDPGWQIEAFVNGTMTAGKPGVMIDQGYLKVGRIAISRNADPAPVA